MLAALQGIPLHLGARLHMSATLDATLEAPLFITDFKQLDGNDEFCRPFVRRGSLRVGIPKKEAGTVH
jgi:hypothetical protein